MEGSNTLLPPYRQMLYCLNPQGSSAMESSLLLRKNLWENFTVTTLTLPLLSIRNLFLTLFYLTGFLKVKHSSVGLPSNYSFKAILILILVYTQPLAINQNHHLCVPSSLWFHSLLLCVSKSELRLSGCTFSLV